MRGKDAGPLPLPARSWQADEPHEALRQRRLRWTAGASAIAVAAALPVLAVPGTPKDAWVAWLGAGVAMGQILAQNMQSALQGGAAAGAGAAAAAPAGVKPEDVMATLEKLGELKAKGILTDDEFNTKKAELLKKLV